MTQLADPSIHQANFTAFEREAAATANTPAWLDTLRRTAMARFNLVGFPTRRAEAWRFTNIDPIVKTKFTLAGMPHDAAGIEAAQSFSFGSDAACELVFLNGVYTPKLSRPGKLPKGVTVQPLAEAIALGTPLVEQHLAQIADLEKNPFVALNTSFLRDGAFIHLARNAALELPIHLLFFSVPTSEPAVTHPRVLVVAEENAEARIVETYAGTGTAGVLGVGGTSPYFTNAVTEFVIASDARIDHCKMQQESLTAYHVATTQVQLAAKASFVSHNATLGAAVTRNDTNMALNGEYADATINGLVVLDGTRHADNHTLLDHAAANCPSHELYKHVLAGKSTGVFKGQILVRKDSQKTDSKQTSKTLLLSDDATMSSMPALEIYADDVKCTHGSTTGPMDEEQLFYLRSRGVAADAARHLMTYAFAADITRRIRIEPARARIENFMAAQHGLPLDLRINTLGGHDEAVTNA